MSLGALFPSRLPPVSRTRGFGGLAPATEETAFRSGQLHITSSLPLQKIEAYQRESPEVLKIVPDLGPVLSEKA